MKLVLTESLKEEVEVWSEEQTALPLTLPWLWEQQTEVAVGW